MYKIIDKHSGTQIGKDYKNRIKANKRADFLDNVYGTYRFIVKLKEVK